MDKDIESKYTKLINEGILSKGVFPKKELFNFKDLQSLEQLKSELNIYLSYFIV